MHIRHKYSFFSSLLCGTALVTLSSICAAVPHAVASTKEVPEVSKPELRQKRIAQRKNGFSITVDGVDVMPVRSISPEKPRKMVRSQKKRPKPALTLPDRHMISEVLKLRSAPEDIQSLDDASIKITFDGIDIKPLLAVSHKAPESDGSSGYEFEAKTNYPSWIRQAEIRIYDGSNGVEDAPFLSAYPVKPNGTVKTNFQEGDYRFYTLRVYDGEGRFNETVPQFLGQPINGVSFNHLTETRNIPVAGGAVSIKGYDLPDHALVAALGEEIPVKTGAFSIQRILPPGDHQIGVEVVDKTGQNLAFGRDVNIPSNKWFYVGLADFSIGHRMESATSGASETEFDEVYTKGRLAFYLKGKVKGKYILTASADTQDGDIETMFKRLNGKSARDVLKRIDPDAYYPVYGDGSTIENDAPTSGNFYVRLDRGDSHVMWGDYRTSIGGTEFLNHSRELYGAHGVYQSKEKTKFGEHKVSVTGYAAKPESLPQREFFSATGGSVFFLKRQDILINTDVVSKVIHDRNTGRIIKTVALVRDKDYTINSAQGVLTLNEPLSAVDVDAETLISDGAKNRYDVALHVHYEYAPLATEVDGLAFGGQAKAWINDRVQLGFTAHSETTDIVDHQAFGANARFNLAKNSYLEAEFARSKGEGFNRTSSDDGGFTITDIDNAGRNGLTADAMSLKAHIDLSDYSDKLSGSLSAYYQSAAAGFSTISREVDVDQRSFGVSSTINISKKLSVKSGFERFDEASGLERLDAHASVKIQHDDRLSFEVGVKGTRERDLSAANIDGERLDGGAKIRYQLNEQTALYAFAQGTILTTGSIDRNDRYGVGAEHKFSDKLSINAEISDGTDDIGGRAQLEYTPEEGRQYYFGYEFDPTKTVRSTQGNNVGAFVSGAKRQHDDRLITYMETKYSHFSDERLITSSHGATYKPDDRWAFGAQIETGKEHRSNKDDFKRNAFSASASYTQDDDIKARIRGEVRLDDSADITRQRDTYMLLGGLSVKLSDDWKFVADGQAIHSTTDQNSIANGHFYEANIGYAYRPAENSRFNALLRYSYIYDLPAADQVDWNGKTLSPAQNSHILSADGNYRLNDYLTLGAKYGYRLGEVSTTRNEDDFVESTAHLGIIRADINIVKKWDFVAEARVMHLPEAENTHYGGLTALYRQFGDNVKVGAGYNFGVFSDDLADVTLDDQGSFFNVIGKF